jgi:hypothetical protein
MVEAPKLKVDGPADEEESPKFSPLVGNLKLLAMGMVGGLGPLRAKRNIHDIVALASVL